MQDRCSKCCCNTMSMWSRKLQELNLRKHFTASSLSTSDPWHQLLWFLHCFLYLRTHCMSLNKYVLIVCQLFVVLPRVRVHSRWKQPDPLGSYRLCRSVAEPPREPSLCSVRISNAHLRSVCVGGLSLFCSLNEFDLWSSYSQHETRMKLNQSHRWIKSLPIQ